MYSGSSWQPQWTKIDVGHRKQETQLRCNDDIDLPHRTSLLSINNLLTAMALGVLTLLWINVVCHYLLKNYYFNRIIYLQNEG